jgi:hypothetical protein
MKVFDRAQDLLGIANRFGNEMVTRRRSLAVDLRCQHRSGQNGCGDQQDVFSCVIHKLSLT